MIAPIPTDQAILKELKKMNRILTLSNGPLIEQELAKYATSDERKVIWVLIDGAKQAPEIAQIIKKTKRAVDMFLQTLEDAELVERPYNKPPLRTIDYVPASWVELTSKITSRAESAPTVNAPTPGTAQQEATSVG